VEWLKVKTLVPEKKKTKKKNSEYGETPGVHATQIEI
jgi:hypothetical protein